MKIIKLSPAYKDYLWGGKKLKEMYHKSTETNIIAESWELSCHKDGLSTIPALENMTLSEYLRNNPGVLGEGVKELPILIKLIDANQDLSVQVHPNDAFARAHEGDNGKNEMWYIVECEPGASIYYGLKETISREDLKRRLENNTVHEVLNKVAVEKGDVYFIEAGKIHAIGKGIVIAEIQQNSNATYRLCDYGRKDALGNARELHIEQGCAVANLMAEDNIAYPVKTGKTGCRNIVSCEYFCVDYIKVNGNAVLSTGVNFKSLLCVNGNGCIKTGDEACSVVKGDCLLLPAGNREYCVEGQLELLAAYMKR